MSATLRHYACGSTRHDLGRMFHGPVRGIRRFPAGVFLYDDARGVRVLFDTGYATGDWHTGWRGAAYRRLLPPEVAESDDVARRLADDGVDPASVTHVVLSHLHPDHVGGVHRFPGARFVLTSAQLAAASAPTLRSGILPGLLPDWFPGAEPIVIEEHDFRPHEVFGIQVPAFDLLGDGSVLIVDLPGHAPGHIGAIVGDVLLAGDAAWGADLIDRVPQLKAVPRAVQHDFPAYRRTAGLLAALAAAGFRVVCSHDPVTQKELLS